MAQVRLAWEQILELGQALATKIKDSDFQPEVLVAVARGGFVPARLLANTLDTEVLTSIATAYADRERSTPRLLAVPEAVDQWSSALVVDDCLESGLSLKLAASYLRDRGPEVRTASLFYTRTTVELPDFTLGLVERPPHFPWEAP